MIDNTEFWKAGGQTGTRDQEFHARSQQEYPDVRIQLLEGMSEEEVVGEEVRLKYDRMARDAGVEGGAGNGPPGGTRHGPGETRHGHEGH